MLVAVRYQSELGLGLEAWSVLIHSVSECLIRTIADLGDVAALRRCEDRACDCEDGDDGGMHFRGF